MLPQFPKLVIHINYIRFFENEKLQILNSNKFY
jgi:hypothetical protein